MQVELRHPISCFIKLISEEICSAKLLPAPHVICYDSVGAYLEPTNQFTCAAWTVIYLLPAHRSELEQNVGSGHPRAICTPTLLPLAVGSQCSWMTYQTVLLCQIKHQVVAAIYRVLVCDAKYQGSIHRNWVGLLLFTHVCAVSFTPCQFRFFLSDFVLVAGL